MPAAFSLARMSLQIQAQPSLYSGSITLCYGWSGDLHGVIQPTQSY
jgi:hypothetical protein